MAGDKNVRRLSVGEVYLDVTDVGPKNGRPVVLLHGFPETSHVWRHQLRALADAGYRAIAPDQRGYNRSDKPPGIGEYSLPKLAGDIVGLLDALAIPRAHIVGHDWGGSVAWSLAAWHPARVDRLVTINGPHPKHAAQEIFRNPAQLRRSYYMFLFQLPFLPEREMKKDAFVVRALRGAAVQKDVFDEETIAAYTDGIHQPGAATAMLNWYRAGLRVGSPKMPPVLARALSIWGEGDPALGKALARPPARWARDVEVRLVPDSGHWVPEEKPDVVCSHLLEFLPR